jgi:hypothetical protein
MSVLAHMLVRALVLEALLQIRSLYRLETFLGLEAQQI